MRKELLTSIIMFILGVGLASGFFVLKNYWQQTGTLSPFGKYFNILTFLQGHEKPKYRVYGYLPYWTLYNSDYLQYDKLTDIAYFGLNITADGDFIKTTDGGNADPGYNQWRYSESLTEVISKSRIYGVRVALTIISHTDDVSDSFLKCRECWSNLADNTIAELKERGIKDVNLNFEYAEYTEPEYAKLYSEFTRFFNARMDAEFGDSSVVVATFADSLTRPRVSSDMENLAAASDGIFIMAYDFHRPTSDVTGPVAPIDGKGVHAEYDIRTMIKDYVSKVAPNKLIMGVPYYGYNWVVESEDKYATRIPGSDETGYSQSQTYEAIKELLIELNPPVQWDELGKSPYFVYRSPETGALREVHYDNPESFKEKYELIKLYNLSGVGIWALGYDGGYEELWNLLGTSFK